MLGPGIHLLLQIANVVDHVRALGVSLGIAGPGHAEVPPAVDEGDQLIGMEKICLGREIGVPVAPQGQHVLHPIPLQSGKQLGGLPPGAGHTGQMGHGGDVVLVLDDGGDLLGGLVHRAGASRTVGDADEVGLDVLQTVQRFINAVHRAGFLGGKYFAGKDSLALSKQFCNFHGIYLLSGAAWVSVFE